MSTWQSPKPLLAALLCGLLALGSPASHGDTCPEPGHLRGFSEQRLSRIGPMMRAYVDQGKLAGIEAIIAQGGETVFHDSWGYRDLETERELGDDTIFRIYSMSKPVTSVALMMLFEQGRLRLNDPVSSYLPEFEHMQVVETGADGSTMLVEAKSPVTVMHLLMHTSGLSYGYGDNEVDRRYRDAGVWAPGQTLEQFTARIASLPLAHQPGTAWRYGVSTDILGRLVEVISGQALDAFMAEHIFRPLGMKDTGFYVPLEKLGRLASIYVQGPEQSLIRLTGERVPGVFETEPSLLSGGGGLVSTSADFQRFAQMLANKGSLNGTRILGRKTVEYMTSNHLPDHMIPIGADAPGSGFGLGFYVVVRAEGTPQLDSKGSYGWGGHASTLFWVDPVEQIVGILLTQFIPFGFHRYHDDFRVLAYQALVDGSPDACLSSQR